MLKQDENTLVQKFQQRYFACEVFSLYEKEISISKLGVKSVTSQLTNRSLRMYWLKFAKELGNMLV